MCLNELLKCLSLFSSPLRRHRLELSTFLPQVVLAPIIPWPDRLFPLRVSLFKNRVLGHIPKLFPFSSPCQKREGVFFSVYNGNLVRFLEINLTTMWVTFELSYFYTLILQQVINSNSDFPARLRFLCWFLWVSLCSSKPRLSYRPVPLSGLGAEVCLVLLSHSVVSSSL